MNQEKHVTDYLPVYLTGISICTLQKETCKGDVKDKIGREFGICV